jgi:hypothetical protein
MDHTGAMTSRAPRNSRPRDGLGRPLPYGSQGVERQPEQPDFTPTQTLQETSRLLADGLPFHAHEVLEEEWKRSGDDEREFWRGLAQLAVGITHAARGNRRGALALLQRGVRGIEPYRDRRPHDVDVDAVLRWADEASASVEQNVPVALAPPPLLPTT